MNTVNILGSCGSGDTAYMLVRSGDWTVSKYHAWSNPYCLIKSKSDYCLSERSLPDVVAPNFDKRCLTQNMNATGLDWVFSQPSDWFLYDNMAAWRPILKLDDHCVTQTALVEMYWGTTFTHQYSLQEYKRISPKDIPDFEWKQIMDTLCAKIKEHYTDDQIILNKYRFVDWYERDHRILNYNDQEFHTWANTLCEKLDGYFLQHFPKAHVIPFPDAMMGGNVHGWGYMGLHYQQPWYDYDADAIRTILSKLPREQEKNRINELKASCEDQMQKYKFYLSK